MATSLELSTRRDAEGIPLVTAVGEIDMSNADRFRDAFGQAAGDDRRRRPHHAPPRQCGPVSGSLSALSVIPV